MLTMAKNVEPQSKVSVKDPMGTKTDTLRRHVEGHNEEKSKKCNQCDYASAHGGNLRTHLTMHRGEKSNKCNKCDFALAPADNLRIHDIMNSEITLHYIGYVKLFCLVYGQLCIFGTFQMCL